MKPYYNQSDEWKQFFLQANDQNHNVLNIDTNGISTMVYQYPFVSNLKFWYVPRIYFEIENGDQSLHLSTLKDLIDKVRSEAKKSNITHISYDFDERLLNKLNLNIEQLNNHLKINLRNPFKKLQYSITPILPTTELLGDRKMTVEDFFKVNEKGFFARTNKTCRNLTRRALEKGWQCEFSNNEMEFEDFWTIWQSTASRQNFNLHPKQYIKTLLNNNFAELAILKDIDGNVQGGWVLVYINDSVINLYGANSDLSLANGGQYYFHVFALRYIKSLIDQGKIVESYDLGGADEAGYGNFKKSYKPEYISFIGQFDEVLKPQFYFPALIIKTIKNKFKSLKLH